MTKIRFSYCVRTIFKAMNVNPIFFIYILCVNNMELDSDNKINHRRVTIIYLNQLTLRCHDETNLKTIFTKKKKKVRRL